MQNKVNKLITLIFQISRKMNEIHSCAFPMMRLETLRFIKESGNAPQMKDVANYLKITPPSATVMINELFGSGLIERVADPKDRRLIRLQLTEIGKKQLDESIRQINKKMESDLKELSEDEKDVLIKILNKFIEKK